MMHLAIMSLSCLSSERRQRTVGTATQIRACTYDSAGGAPILIRILDNADSLLSHVG